MENDKQNLITRVITYLVIFLGVLFTLIVMSDDNPKEMNPEQIKVAAFNNDQFEFEKDEKGRFIKDKFGNYTYKDLDNDSTYSKSEGEILRNYQTSLEQTLDSHVFTLTFFSIVTVTATFLLLILGFGYLAYINWAKAKKILTGVGIFVLFMLIVYFISVDDRGTDWTLANTAINSTVLLILIALISWIGGSVIKLRK
ncbi:hypothetical protein N9V04_00370 [Bacteroidota bacterium]|nr:hypothetical protein [Crocinitomicaceae bacterium]MDA9714838.1 hypothetical protein [Bacteroidota bacterium]MEC7004891.1 hypothetical protein [Bacteroidota bacterium]MEC7527237.1 hypothetical protein [Bacteroidota bacterium]MEC7618447.1 hypothetical protein [Bacteroidota bacterium]|tara:strand:- start:1155 stop:1748 length:594 start_codon:yes stop_codon:yes gene_type:complete